MIAPGSHDKVYLSHIAPGLRSVVDLNRPIPLPLRIWFFLLALWTLSDTPFTAYLRGFRITYQHFYLEFIIPLTLIVVLRKSKDVKLPRQIFFLGFWLVALGIVGYLKGYNPSIIYDRSRNWASLVVLLLLLYSYQVSSKELIQLLKPVFFASVLGYTLAVVLSISANPDFINIRDTLGFNFMFAAFAVSDYWGYGRLRWWHLPTIIVAFIPVVYLAARAKLLSMLVGLLIPNIRLGRYHFFRSLILFVTVVSIAVAVIFAVQPAQQAMEKNLQGSGLAIDNLTHTTIARFQERVALRYQMQGLDYLLGEGAGATWDGRRIYETQIGTERQIFHIYYLEIFYWYGFIGFMLWIWVGIIPFVKGVLDLKRLDTIGVMGVCSLGALLLAWFGHANYSMSEGSYIAVSLYALQCGRKLS